MADIGFQGRGCSLSQASGSMMTEAVKGKTIEEARSLIAEFTQMMTDPEHAAPEELGDLEAFSGVARYPVRVKCATLAWHASARPPRPPRGDRAEELGHALL